MIMKNEGNSLMIATERDIANAVVQINNALRYCARYCIEMFRVKTRTPLLIPSVCCFDTRGSLFVAPKARSSCLIRLSDGYAVCAETGHIPFA